MRAVLYKADGNTCYVEPKNGTDFTLEELQGFVGGYIEVVSIDSTTIMVVNEEGKMLGLDFNITATAIYNDLCGSSDCIVGDVLLCDTSMVR